MARYKIELTEEQLNMISQCVEFASRFHCGQIGHSYLPFSTQELFYKRGEGENVDWKESHRNIELFNQAGELMKRFMHLELDRGTYGVNKFDYSDNLYDIYKMINYRLQKENYEDDVSWNVNSSYTKFGNLDDIKVEKIEGEE